MTNEEAIKEIENASYNERKYGDIKNHRDEVMKRLEAFDLAIKAIDKISHLIDRPCEACEFHKENGCCKWSCVFEEVNADASGN